MFRIRHDAIARTAFEIAYADEHLRQELRDVHYDTARAVVSLFPDGWRSPRVSRIFYLSQPLLDAGYDSLAIAAAEGARDGGPRNLYLATALAATYRKASRTSAGAARGAAVLEAAAGSLDNFTVDTRDALRPFFGEWAACVGSAGSTVGAAAASLVLAVHSMSDGLAPEPLAPRHINIGLAEAGRALLDVARRQPTFGAETALAAVAALGTVARVNPAHVRAYTQAAGGTSPPELTDAVANLEDAARNARRLFGDAELAVADTVGLNAQLGELRAKLTRAGEHGQS
jgi:hypothetical protein